MMTWKLRIRKGLDLVADPRNPLWVPAHLVRHGPFRGPNHDNGPEAATFSLTVDVEQDFGLKEHLDSYRGIEKGLPLLLDLLEREEITSTFFVQQTVLTGYPGVIEDVNSAGHEVGYHGKEHEVWGDTRWWLPDDRILTPSEKRECLDEGINRIAELIGERPRSFRAPYMVANEGTLDILEDSGFKCDSSGAAYHGVEPRPLRSRRQVLVRIPVSANPRPRIHLTPVPHARFEFLQTSTLTRSGIDGALALARSILSYQVLHGIPPHLVMLSHPWEYIDHARIPGTGFDYAGKTNILHLKDFIRALKKEFDFKPVTMGALAREVGP